MNGGVKHKKNEIWEIRVNRTSQEAQVPGKQGTHLSLTLISHIFGTLPRMKYGIRKYLFTVELTYKS